MTIPILLGLVILLLGFISMNNTHQKEINKEFRDKEESNKQHIELLNEHVKRKEKIPNLIKKIFEANNNFRFENSKYEKNTKLVLNTDIYKFTITICEEEGVILYGGSRADGRTLLKIDYANDIVPKTNFKYNLYDEVDLFNELYNFISDANKLCKVKHHPFEQNNQNSKIS
ncbi:hypothetical protein APS56_08625 [Pseudalgibacter alginicilyticus]|uniref:Uncharacterized protein n=1 Tax=Pseudalgibacter alginicilyticus TaxID=1736674 RepID=A0A0P0DB86_9FLAO|nr:hypothetical protein [Pseudalgibacter alginicilyticus]ALJ05183.1 hypothetical protein APS56_08625 [Pseudalgibacter alginicilyticus]